MSQQSEPVLFLYDSEQRLQGVLVSPEFWELIKDRVCPLLPAAAPAAAPELPEPLADWETLGAYWDFTYPLSSEVACGQCGQHSADWQADEPRKFRLRTATLGGLVTFQCQQCKAKIIKRHFKDKVDTETQAHHETKDPKLNACYGPAR
jgi:hypothetical protein